jgi:hypothetical protein
MQVENNVTTQNPGLRRGIPFSLFVLGSSSGKLYVPRFSTAGGLVKVNLELMYQRITGTRNGSYV